MKISDRFMKKEFDQPSSIEAEKAVLGGLLLEPELWDTVSVEVEEDDFMLVEHKLIYRSIRRLRDHGNEVDTVTHIESLTNDPDISSLSNFNQNEYIKKLASVLPKNQILLKLRAPSVKQKIN